jgi:hypothetical protein
LLTPLLDPKRIALAKLPKPAPAAVEKSEKNEKIGKGVVAEAPARSERSKKK